MNMWYVYALQSQRNLNWFYKGSTNNLKGRIDKHNRGIVPSTRPYGPFRLVYYESYLTENAVRLRESSIKKGGSVWKPLMDRIKASLKE